MREHGMYSWSNPWLRWSILSVCGTTVAAVLVGFVWLPSAQSDFSAQGIWASICRAAGVPQDWGAKSNDAPRAGRTTTVVLDQAMTRLSASDAEGRGATLALQRCTMCHGVRGVTQTSIPNLAGQYAEVILKQLSDYQTGDRASSIMQAMAANLSARDVSDLATYYASLPRSSQPHDAVTGGTAPQLVNVADAMRNIASCTSCHGGVDRKLGAPWLDGLSHEYLAAQLTAFASGARKNDSHAQMRNMARQLTPAEINALAAFYAKR
jgi:cytochrome c553